MHFLIIQTSEAWLLNSTGWGYSVVVGRRSSSSSSGFFGQIHGRCVLSMWLTNDRLVWIICHSLSILLICKCRPSRLLRSSYHVFQIAKTARTILNIQRSMWSQIDPVWWNKAFVKSPWKSDVLYNYWEFRTNINSAATSNWRWRCPEDIQIFIITLRTEIVSANTSILLPMPRWLQQLQCPKASRPLAEHVVKLTKCPWGVG